MYIPEYFKTEDLTLIHDIMRQYNFATLINQADAGPVISHLPLRFSPEASGHGFLFGHLAKPNPHWKLWAKDKRITVLFHGPHSYISPRWYEPAPDNVPTWNYATVHVHGEVEIMAQEPEAFKEMTALVKQHDPSWPLELSERDRKGMMAGIVVFQIKIQGIEAKFKLNQNHPVKNRENVTRELAKSESSVDRETGALMSRVKSCG
jgi:transcriptional regulator